MEYPIKEPRRIVALATIILVAAFCGVSSVAAQSAYEDLEGRFALELPAGWKLDQEQFGILYQFGSKGGASLMITYNEGETEMASLFADQVEYLTSSGYRPPPPNSVVTMTLNGCPAQWAEYESPMEVEGIELEMFAFAGAVLSDEDDAGVGFMAFMSVADEKKMGDDIRNVWESLRLHGRPATGVTDVASGSYEDTVKAAAPASPSTFEHELVSLNLPAGWTTEEPSGPMQIVKLKHEDLGTVTLLGSSGDDLGESPEHINTMLRDVVMSTVPSMKQNRESWTLETKGCGQAALEQFAGALIARGTKIDQGAIIAATKDKRGGVGYMAFYSSKVTDEAITDIQNIIQSAH